MKQTFLLVFFLFLTTIVYSQTKWIGYSESFKKKRIVSFKYPDSLNVERIQNGICIGNQRYYSNDINDTIHKIGWCIWIGFIYPEKYNIAVENLIKEEKSKFNLSVIEHRQIIKVAKRKAIKVVIKEEISGKILNETVYFRKYGINYIINNETNVSDTFDEFLKSIVIEK